MERKKRGLIVIVFSLFLLVFSSTAQTVEININAVSFPATTTINVGDTVRWNHNHAGVPHTVTFDTPPNSGTFNSPGNFQRTFNTAGSFPYSCDVHGAAAMSGTIVVQAAPPPPESPSANTPPAQPPTQNSPPPAPTPSPPANQNSPSAAAPINPTGNGPLLEGWDLFNSDGTIDDQANIFIIPQLEQDAGYITLGDRTLRSMRIPIPQTIEDRPVQLSFSIDSQDCNPELTLYDNNGDITSTETTGTFATTGATYLTVELSNCRFRNPLLQVLDTFDPADYISDTRYPDRPRSGLACCPENHCWNGHACVEPMDSKPGLAEEVSETRNYRCVAGEWRYQPLKRDWHNSLPGFCTAESQCFVLKGGDSTKTAQDAYNGEFPTCVNDGDFIFDHYCEDGNWTSRTKFLAAELIDRAGNEDYTLYCSGFQDNLIDTSRDIEILAGQPVAAAANDPTGLATTTSLCHTGAFTANENWNTLVGRDNTCINNVCILKTSDQTLFAVSLNRNLNDPLSFLNALGSTPRECPQGDGFAECDAGIRGELLFSSRLNSVIYGRDGASASSSFIARTLDFFRNLLGIDRESGETSFISDVQNFRDVYILKSDNKEVRAVRHILPEQEVLRAEYENFDTPVCEYVTEQRINQPSLRRGPLPAAANDPLITCTEDGSIQRVEAFAGLDFLWPQLTGKLRTATE
jgi:plastocyanin